MIRDTLTSTKFGSRNLGRYAGDPLRAAVSSAASVDNTVPAAISGIGYTGQTLTAVAGTWSGGTATGQWYADDVAISGETALTYVVSVANNGAALKYVETNNGVVAESNVIHHMLPTDVGVQAWFEANDPTTITLGTGDLITQWDDKSGNARHMAQVSESLQCTFDDASERVISAPGKVLGEMPSMTTDAIITVLQYKTGVETETSTYSAVYSNGSFTKRILTSPSGSLWFSGDIAGSVSRVNGSLTSTSTAVPMPTSVQRFMFTSPVTNIVTPLGYPSTAAYSWNGSTKTYIIPNTSETLANLQILEAYSAWSTGIQADLSTDNPYTAAPPTVGA